MILALIVFLALTYEVERRSALPFLLASGGSLLTIVTLFIKIRTYRETKRSLYLFVAVMIVMVVVSVLLSLSYYVSSPFPQIAMSFTAFTLAVVTTLEDLRTKQISTPEETGCAIVVVSTIALFVLAFVLFMYFAWMP